MQAISRLAFIPMVLLLFSPAYSQDLAIPECLVNWGQIKVIDGAMNEWSPLGGVGGHGTAENEHYIYDSMDNCWNAPQGGDGDQPLSILVLKDHPEGTPPSPMPVMSGLNLWGAYLCYEPFHEGYSVSVALDLPLSSHPELSPDYEHTYNKLPPHGTIFLPVAFDCDGNGDPATANSHEYFPYSENGFNYIKDDLWFYDDWDEEVYIVSLCFGDDIFLQREKTDPAESDDRSLIGLPIVIELKSKYGIINPPTAVIPSPFTKRGVTLDLVATYGADVLEVSGHDQPDPDSTPRIVDIEIKLNKLKTILDDDRYIDWEKTTIPKFPATDLRIIYLKVKSGSIDDQSNMHHLSGGHEFPALPIKPILGENGP